MSRRAPSDPGALVKAPSNLTGICDRTIQSNIDAALNGTPSAPIGPYAVRRARHRDTATNGAAAAHPTRARW